MLGTMRSSRALGKPDDLAMVEWIDLESRPLPESVQELTGGKGADLILDAVGGPLFEPCLQSLAPRGRQIAVASAGNPQVTFNLVDFYHKEACLLGVDTLKLSPGEAAEILTALLPGFKAGIFSPPTVEAVSLDDAGRPTGQSWREAPGKSSLSGLSRDGGPKSIQWGDGYQAALINFSFLAHAVMSTDEVVKAMG